jgi:hypothetical protein
MNAARDKVLKYRNLQMFYRAKEIEGYKLSSLDGEFGKVKEFYFDDKFWTIRYLIADTGNWLPGRQVLISPYAVTGVNRIQETVDVNLTKDKIENSPSPETDKPLSRQFENYYYGYYAWPDYWGGPYSWGDYPYISHDGDNSRDWTENGQKFDHHLRSTRVVTGSHVEASDGAIGHVEEFIIDDKTWAIRYLIVDTQNWLPGKRVLVSPQWIQTIDWAASEVFFNVPRATIKAAPEYLRGSFPTRDYETAIHSHYKRQGYWANEPISPLVAV